MGELLASSFDADAVTSLLRDLRVISTVYCRSDLAAPWGFGVPAREMASFHIVVSGGCWLEVAGSDRGHLSEGDLVLILGGDEHWVRDDPTSAATWLEEFVQHHPVDACGRMQGGGHGLRTSLVCGGFAIEGHRRHPVLSMLPPVLHIRASRGLPDWLARTLDLIALEAHAPTPGAAAVCERLSELLLAQALRIVLLELSGPEGAYLPALRDAGIAAAMRATHDRPEHPWTLAELASTASMSRSGFTARFRQLTGESPIRYVHRQRLVRAATQLRVTDSSVAQIATHAGYAAESSFSRAFKRTFGIAPGAYRHEPLASGS